MKEYTITQRDAGQGLYKYLCKIFPEAPSGLLHKQLRNKNINLNNKKASGQEKLTAGDRVQVFFSDETITKFEGAVVTDNPYENVSTNIKVLYENEDIIAIDKPAGLLTQKAKNDDISLNEMLLAYLIKTKAISASDLKTVKPSVCNRLDRNTSGIVLCGKTMTGLVELSKALKDRYVHKYYVCIVKGEIESANRYEGYLTKSHSHNQVKITDKAIDDSSQYICTEYKPISVKQLELPGAKHKQKVTYLEVLLVTGRSHQIRAHLASLGHPLIGDPKYGDIQLNKLINRKYKINRQLLHAMRVEFTDNLVIESSLPDDMKDFV